MGLRDISPIFTEDGFELTFGINHLGHFLLTLLLLDDLKKNTPDARIVVLTSSLHDPNVKGGGGKPAHIDFDNLQLLAPGSFDSGLAYKNSKLANVLFAYELDRRLHGTGVTVNAVCPGFIPSTELFRHNPVVKCYLICCCNILFRCFRVTRTISSGAENVVFVATSDKLRGIGGKFFKNCEQVESSVESRDRDVADKLWKVSAEMVHIDTAQNVELM